ERQAKPPLILVPARHRALCPNRRKPPYCPAAAGIHLFVRVARRLRNRPGRCGLTLWGEREKCCCKAPFSDRSACRPYKGGERTLLVPLLDELAAPGPAPWAALYWRPRRLSHSGERQHNR